MDNRKISIAIPVWERDTLLFESFADVYEDSRVSEIIIVDDCSSKELFDRIKWKCDLLPKVKLYRNINNQDCHRNKHTAVSFANNSFAILLDSDNVISKDYIDAIYAIENWKEDTIYTPELAAPAFDFRAYSILNITKENVSEYIDKPLFQTMLNAANYFIPVKRWLEVWDGSVDALTSDSIFVCMNWLKSGGTIHVTGNLQYQHRIHSGSHYQQKNSLTPAGFHENILEQLRNMK